MTPWFESVVFGAANSLHCAFMCGPLAVAFQGGTKGACSYHLGRSVAYGAVGVVLGGIGCAVGSSEIGAPAAWVAFVLASGLIGLEVRGARGDFAINRLGVGELTFRSALASAVPIGAAVHKATAVEPAFDAMRAVVSLIASGLVTQVHATAPAAEVCP